MNRWMLSAFFRDDTGTQFPVCIAYGQRYSCPSHPPADAGLALVYVSTTAIQLEAAQVDSRVTVLPSIIDPSPVPQSVVDCYAGAGITAGMNLYQVLSKLGESDPSYTIGM
jgi:hypothetical protein